MAARLTTDEAGARRIADHVAERFDTLEAVTAACEEAPGYWSVAIHFPDPPDETVIRALVAHAIGDEAAASLTFETTTPQDWVKASLDGLAPVEAGRFIIHGAHDREHIPLNRIGIEVEAALAFGTGHHGTTRGCLIALDRIAKNRTIKNRITKNFITNKRITKARRPRHMARPVLDVGTGTGVLAIAAARALRRPVLASDIDPIAVTTARENARINRAAGFITFVQAAGVRRSAFRNSAPFDLIFANILLGPLVKLAAPLARLAAPGARIVLSGLLPSQANATLAAYRVQGLHLERRTVLDGWATLVVRQADRRHSSPGLSPQRT
jgi:ribosomal protein L11 methyltransferase